MAGHSKWTNTKYRKATQDTKRSKIFTKITRELVTAVRVGGKNPDYNPRLRMVIDKALYNNMTRDTLNRAIYRAIGKEKNIKMRTFTYEGYGPNGIAIILKCISNNKNRTSSELRHVFNKHGGNLSTSGSVIYLFKKRGIISFDKGFEDNIIEIALEAGAEDVLIHNDGSINVYTELEKIEFINSKLEISGLKAKRIGISMIPLIKNKIDENNLPKFLNFIYMLKNLVDVQEIYHNGNFYEKNI